MICPHCQRPCVLGPCQSQEASCNHDWICPEHGRMGTQSWNLEIGQKAHDAAFRRSELPLFQEIA